MPPNNPYYAALASAAAEFASREQPAADVSPSTAAINAVLQSIDQAQSVLGREGNGYAAIQLRRPLAEIVRIRDVVRDSQRKAS